MRLNLPRFISQCFEHLFFLWAFAWLTLTGLVAALGYFGVFNAFSGKQAQHYTFWLTKTWAKALFALIFVRVQVDFDSPLDPEQAHIIVSNHRSALDIPICMYASALPFSFLAKKEVDKIPVIGYLARNMHIYVDRKSPESRRDSLQRMAYHLAQGKSIHIYPEGTRNRSEEALLPFHDGAFRLAIETQTPILVMTIQGSGGGRPLAFSPCQIYCTYAQPICTKGLSLDDVDMLKAKVREQMLLGLSRSPVYF